MAWLQVHLGAEEAHVDALQTLLETLGAVAVTITDAADQPLFEPPPGEMPLWKHTIVSALFTQTTDADLLAQALKSALGDDLPNYRMSILEDQPWERAWMEDFKPMRFGEKLWIVPSWTDAPDPSATNIKLDPGLAFGTGTHETTALCLEWLDQADLAGKTVIDFGCGSGVLAIAALLLGAEHAWACDIDPQALLATESNAANNHVADRLTCVLAKELPADLRTDVVLANILAGPLVELSDQLSGLCHSRGHIVLSGILAAQGDSVVEAYAKTFDVDAPMQKNDWLRVTGRKH